MKTYAKLALKYGTYNANSSDNYLEMICNIFDDSFAWTKGVKEMLLDHESEGLIGNKTDIEKINNIIKISPLYADNPEEYAIEIDRNQLLDLINKWELLANQKTPEIYLVRHEDGSIDMTDHVPKE
jgi:hypothetical protein